MEINLIFHYSTEGDVIQHKEKINFPCRLNRDDEVNIEDIVMEKDFPKIKLWTVKSCWFISEQKSIIQSVLLVASHENN